MNIFKYKNVQWLFYVITISISTLNAQTYTATWGAAPWDWTDGDTSKTIQVDTTPDGSDVIVDIDIDYSQASGDKDGGPSFDDASNGFAGDIDDLEVSLDPDENQGTSPITITLTFNHPVYNTSFKITDIDSRITDGSESTDKVTITTDKGNPTISIVNTDSTTVTTVTDTEAYSDTDHDLRSNNDTKGSINVVIPDGAKKVTIVYEDIYPANDDDTTMRGIGLFGDLTFDTKDTDGDGILDDVDIDDDGDGILDSVEIQGGGNCAYGFFHVIGGVLYVFDVQNSVYVAIGGQKDAYNGLGYDEQTGKMYAVMREDSTDDYNTSLAKNDIIEVDRYTGKIKKASKQMNTYAADFYNGALYGRTTKTKVAKWKQSDNSKTTISLDDNINWADLAILPDGNTPMAYGLRTNDTSSGASNKTDLYRVNLNDGTTSIIQLTVTTPDGNDLDKAWGATFLAKDGDTYHFYASNNNGYIYEIENFNSGTPTARFVYRSVATSSNDGASCKDANQYAVDTDGDGFPDYLDLDSDNDGIPDNIEAQATDNYIEPSGLDDDNDGLDDAYDDDTSNKTGSNGLIPPDKDGDNKADFVDTDSDNDGYSDCEEGNTHADCNNLTVGNNGMPNWADNGDDYSDVNGNVDDPEDDGQLKNETGDTTEAAYREFLCGKTNYQLSDHKWRLISVPCNTGSLSIKDLFGDTLGDYDTHWVMYKQIGDDNYEVYNGHKNTNKTKLTENDTLDVGVSYWIITDADKNITIDKTLNGLSPTTTTNASDVSINDDLFDKVHELDLPANDADNVKKFMTGNPFPYKFDFSKLYFKNENTSYKMMGDSTNDDYVLARIYTHDSSDTSDKNVSSGGGYTVIAPQTPGLSEGQILPMEGFFIELEKQSDEKTNKLAYPLMMQYSN